MLDPNQDPSFGNQGPKSNNMNERWNTLTSGASAKPGEKYTVTRYVFSHDFLTYKQNCTM